MEATLTEFSYGYCVTEEFAKGAGPVLTAAPYFPSLYREGKKGGGFDVRIGSAVFLQFKLSEELRQRNARETQEGLLEPTFFRFWLHRRGRSNQHKMLIQLERQPGNQVYYIAPAFADVQALDTAYNDGAVVERSSMFSPLEIGPLPDDKHHSVAFRLDEPCGWFLSEPKRIAIHHKAIVIERALSRGVNTEFFHLNDWLNSLAQRMAAIINEFMTLEGQVGSDSKTEGNPQLDALGRVEYLARTYFGCELFLLALPAV